MGRSWFTEGSQIELRVVKQDRGWYVRESEAPGDTSCIFQNGSSPDGSEGTVSVEVVSYRQGAGDRTNYLTVEVLDEPDASNAQRDNSSSSSEPRSTSDGQAAMRWDEYPERSLSQFQGTGDYVTVEAEVAWIEYVKKGVRDMPDLKGVLREPGTVKTLPFVVNNDVTHPYFEAGERFRFIGVKDHKYQKKSEVQALITEQTEFVKL